MRYEDKNNNSNEIGSEANYSEPRKWLDIVEKPESEQIAKLNAEIRTKWLFLSTQIIDSVLDGSETEFTTAINDETEKEELYWQKGGFYLKKVIADKSEKDKKLEFTTLNSPQIKKVKKIFEQVVKFKNLTEQIAIIDDGAVDSLSKVKFAFDPHLVSLQANIVKEKKISSFYGYELYQNEFRKETTKTSKELQELKNDYISVHTPLFGKIEHFYTKNIYKELCTHIEYLLSEKNIENSLKESLNKYIVQIDQQIEEASNEKLDDKKTTKEAELEKIHTISKRCIEILRYDIINKPAAIARMHNIIDAKNFNEFTFNNKKLTENYNLIRNSDNYYKYKDYIHYCYECFLHDINFTSKPSYGKQSLGFIQNVAIITELSLLNFILEANNEGEIVLISMSTRICKFIHFMNGAGITNIRLLHPRFANIYLGFQQLKSGQREKHRMLLRQQLPTEISDFRNDIVFDNQRITASDLRNISEPFKSLTSSNIYSAVIKNIPEIKDLKITKGKEEELETEIINRYREKKVKTVEELKEHLSNLAQNLYSKHFDDIASKQAVQTLKKLYEFEKNSKNSKNTKIALSKKEIKINNTKNLHKYIMLPISGPGRYLFNFYYASDNIEINKKIHANLNKTQIDASDLIVIASTILENGLENKAPAFQLLSQCSAMLGRWELAETFANFGIDKIKKNIQKNDVYQYCLFELYFIKNLSLRHAAAHHKKGGRTTIKILWRAHKKYLEMCALWSRFNKDFPSEEAVRLTTIPIAWYNEYQHACEEYFYFSKKQTDVAPIFDKAENFPNDNDEFNSFKKLMDSNFICKDFITTVIKNIDDHKPDDIASFKKIKDNITELQNITCKELGTKEVNTIKGLESLSHFAMLHFSRAAQIKVSESRQEDDANTVNKLICLYRSVISIEVRLSMLMIIYCDGYVSKAKSLLIQNIINFDDIDKTCQSLRIDFQNFRKTRGSYLNNNVQTSHHFTKALFVIVAYLKLTMKPKKTLTKESLALLQDIGLSIEPTDFTSEVESNAFKILGNLQKKLRVGGFPYQAIGMFRKEVKNDAMKRNRLLVSKKD